MDFWFGAQQRFEAEIRRSQLWVKLGHEATFGTLNLTARLDQKQLFVIELMNAKDNRIAVGMHNAT